MNKHRWAIFAGGGAALLFAAGCLLSQASAAADLLADDNAALFEKVRQSDLELASIGWRLSSANAALCDTLEPGLGVQFHTLDQFNSGMREEARAHFHFAASVAIEGVIADGPAAQAGLRADDSVVRIGSIDTDTIKGKAGTLQKLIALHAALSALPADAPIEIEAIRAGEPIAITVKPLPICRTRFELQLDESFDASSDGEMVQVSWKLLDAYRGDQAVAAIAHEFSHNVLHHPDRLAAKGVNFGMLSGFGGNVKYFRQTELQADILSVYVLANAGYPPDASVAFWRDFGPKHAGGILRSRSHPYWRDRIATLEAEITEIKASQTRPLIPDVLASREQPLDGNWKPLLVRHR
jgi:hypothetical protein